MPKINWTPQAVQKLGLVFTVMALALALHMGGGHEEGLQANTLVVAIENQKVECFHRITKTGQMIECGEKGCLYPGGSYCTVDGCFSPNGTSTEIGYDIDFTCRNADGSDKFGDSSLRASAPERNSEIAGEGVSAESQMKDEMKRLNQNLERVMKEISRLKGKGIDIQDSEEKTSEIRFLIEKAKIAMATGESQEFWEVSKEVSKEIDKDLLEKLKKIERDANLSMGMEELTQKIRQMEKDAGSIRQEGGKIPQSFDDIKELRGKVEKYIGKNDLEAAEMNMGKLDAMMEDFERRGGLYGATDLSRERGEDVLRKIAGIDDRIAKLGSERKINDEKLRKLMEIKERVAGYSFVGDSGEEIRKRLEAFMGKIDDLSPEDIEREVEKLNTDSDEIFRKARKEKFENGVIPFADTDEGQWYTDFAKQAKERGLVKGTGTSGGTELNPSGETNLAEAVTLFARLGGVNEQALPSSEVGRRMPEWAKAAAATLEKRGIDLDGIFGEKRPEEPIARKEVARMLVVLLGLSEGDADKFPDVRNLIQEEKRAIGAVNSAGIMTGEGGGESFNPHGPLNRAALTKVLISADGN